MRVLVTRPEPEAHRTARAVRARGAVPVLAPLFTAEPLPPSTLPERIDALVVTSARTLAYLDSGARARLAGLPVFAVGARTAAALEAAGFRAIRSTEADVTALARTILAAGLPQGAVLYSPGGSLRAGNLGRDLAARGFVLHGAALYRMVAVPALPAAAVAALEAGAPDVLHYSPHAAVTCLRLATEAGLRDRLASCRHLCLSAAVAGPLRAAGFDLVAEAAAPTEDDLMTLLPLGGLQGDASAG